MHFRGPLQLHQLAVYTTSKNTAAPAKSRARRHGHQHLHKKRHQHHQERAVGDTVVATIDGKVVSWKNTYAGPTADAVAPAAPPAPTAADKPAANNPVNNHQKAQTDGNEPITGDYEQCAYYEASSGTARGLVFLANVGDPAVSGTWDT
jgi:hypothetical protein